MFAGKYIARKIKQAKLEAGLRVPRIVPKEIQESRKKVLEYSASREKVG